MRRGILDEGVYVGEDKTKRDIVDFIRYYKWTKTFIVQLVAMPGGLHITINNFLICDLGLKQMV